MSPSVHKMNRETVQRLREKAEAAETTYELSEQSGKAAALLGFDKAVQELNDALMEERPPGQD
jgi:hypothetical protein